MRIIDSHFHSPLIVEKGFDIRQICSYLSGGIDVGTVYNDLEERFKLVGSFSHIKMAAAMGPWETENTDLKTLEKRFEILKFNIEKYNPLFIGEAGLDYFCSYGEKSIQKELLQMHFDLAKILNKAIIIHNRESDLDMIEAIKSNHLEKGGIIHCFSGNKDLLTAALDNNFFISYAGNFTFKANQNLRDTLQYVPKDRLLLETDSPYLTPVPLRGRPNCPKYIIYLYKMVSDFLGVAEEELSEQIYSNFTTLIL